MKASRRRWRRHWMNRRTVSTDLDVQLCYRCDAIKGQRTRSAGFCKVCSKHLCDPCIETHRRSPITKRHTILDKYVAENVKVDHAWLPEVWNNAKEHPGDSVVIPRFTRGKTLTVKAPEDKRNCWISGSVLLSPDILLLVDYYNICVKTIETSTDTITARVDLTTLPWKPRDASPWDACVLPQGEVAVSIIYEKTIQILDTRHGLTVGRRMEVGGCCMGLDYCDDKLAVSFKEPPKVKVINIQGDVLFTFSNEGRPRNLFMEPNYISISREDDTIVLNVSDSTNFVRKLTLDGQTLSIHVMENTAGSRGICTMNGKLLVCGVFSNTVYWVSPTLRKLYPILEKDNCVDRAFAVCYCPVKQCLFVSSQNFSTPSACNFIHIFNECT